MDWGTIGGLIFMIAFVTVCCILLIASMNNKIKEENDKNSPDEGAISGYKTINGIAIGALILLWGSLIVVGIAKLFQIMI